jgi:uncharacterized protein YdeI (YjbR/CyaY-like superfamily)
VRGGEADAPRLAPASRAEWRSWLAAHHGGSSGAWVVVAKKRSGAAGPTYEEAVEEALCFGWIDSRMHRLDEGRFEQRFSPRRAGSIWSGSNKERVQRLRRAGLMAPAGLACVEAAVADGSWDLLGQVEALVVPADLAVALEGAGTAGGFEGLPASMRKQLLYWVATARRPQTRARRITAAVEAAAEGRTPLPPQ